MNYEMLREIVRLKRAPLILLGFLLAGALSAVGYGAFFQRPALARAEDALAKARQQAAGSAAGTPASRYHAAQKELALFRERVMDKKAFPSFLARVFETAQRNSLSLKQVNYKPTPIAGEGLLNYEIGFTVSGRYDSVKSFISELTRFREIVVIDSISLMNPSATEERIDLRVQMTTYLKTEGA
jgi:type IV pilus assembly protein PilO